jgi:hypothetical protein
MRRSKGGVQPFLCDILVRANCYEIKRDSGHGGILKFYQVSTHRIDGQLNFLYTYHRGHQADSVVIWCPPNNKMRHCYNNINAAGFNKYMHKKLERVCCCDAFCNLCHPQNSSGHHDCQANQIRRPRRVPSFDM